MTPALGFLETELTGSNLKATERPPGPLGRLFGGVSGFAFLAVAVFFFLVDLEDPLWGKLVLCGCLSLIGIGLIYSVLSPSRQRFLEVDGTAREIRYGVTTKAGTRFKGSIPMNTLEQFYMGVDTSPDDSIVTGLYATGPGTPRKRLLLNGYRHELQAIIQFVQKILGRKF